MQTSNDCNIQTLNLFPLTVATMPQHPTKHQVAKQNNFLSVPPLVFLFCSPQTAVSLAHASKHFLAMLQNYSTVYFAHLGWEEFFLVFSKHAKIVKITRFNLLAKYTQWKQTEWKKNDFAKHEQHFLQIKNVASFNNTKCPKFCIFLMEYCAGYKLDYYMRAYYVVFGRRSAYGNAAQEMIYGYRVPDSDNRIPFGNTEQETPMGEVTSRHYCCKTGSIIESFSTSDSWTNVGYQLIDRVLLAYCNE